MKEQADTDYETMLRHLELGKRIWKGLDKDKIEIEERIFVIVQEYDRYAQTNDLLTYLKNIGYYVKF